MDGNDIQTHFFDLRIERLKNIDRPDRFLQAGNRIQRHTGLDEIISHPCDLFQGLLGI